MTTLDELRALLARPEGRGVELKSATSGFHFEDLVKYCVAIANEGGGTIWSCPDPVDSLGLSAS